MSDEGQTHYVGDECPGGHYNEHFEDDSKDYVAENAHLHTRIAELERERDGARAEAARLRAVLDKLGSRREGGER